MPVDDEDSWLAPKNVHSLVTLACVSGSFIISSIAEKSFQQRHISDRSVNNRKCHIVRNGQLKEETWSKVQVGDMIRMSSNQFVAVSLSP